MVALPPIIKGLLPGRPFVNPYQGFSPGKENAQDLKVDLREGRLQILNQAVHLILGEG